MKHRGRQSSFGARVGLNRGSRVGRAGSRPNLTLVGDEKRIVHGYYTSNKTGPFLGEQGGVLTVVASGHYCKDIAAVVRWHA